MNTLLLKLEGPLQSWGLRARWEERDTAFEPTKSGVIGMLGCALGLRRDDDRLRALSEAFIMGVRVDLPGDLLVDYHTTGGAKQPDGAPQGMLNAQGKLKRETDVSKRVYLMDAAFLVALQSADEALIDELATAVQNPVWPCFLGRKACVPSRPVFAGTGDYPDLERALHSQPLHARARPPVRLLLETGIGQGTLRNDTIGVPARRIFWPRAVEERLSTPDPLINTLEG